MNYVMLFKWVSSSQNSWTTLVVNKISNTCKSTDGQRYRWQERTGESKWQWQWAICWPFLLLSGEAMACLDAFCGTKTNVKGQIVCAPVCLLMFPLCLSFSFSPAVCEDVSATWCQPKWRKSSACKTFATEWLIRWNRAVMNVALTNWQSRHHRHRVGKQSKREQAQDSWKSPGGTPRGKMSSTVTAVRRWEEMRQGMYR